jgi:integrase
VGRAVIDCLKNGRPVSDSPCIFLRHLAPVMPFSHDDHLHRIIVKCMHSLRHTLATTLLEQHVPLQEIAEILGHQDTGSTSVYLKSSLELLRECSLNPEVL